VTAWTRLVPILQVAIGPAILISGVGLLLLTMTNRFGRIIDRARQLARELAALSGEGHAAARELRLAQLRILSRRTRIVRLAIALACLSALLAALLVMAIFVTALVASESATAITVLFAACLGCLIASLLFFFRDIDLSLSALALETGAIDPAGGGRRHAEES
jgi:hypothetical protein